MPKYLSMTDMHKIGRKCNIRFEPHKVRRSTWFTFTVTDNLPSTSSNDFKKMERAGVGKVGDSSPTDFQYNGSKYVLTGAQSKRNTTDDVPGSL